MFHAVLHIENVQGGRSCHDLIVFGRFHSAGHFYACDTFDGADDLCSLGPFSSEQRPSLNLKRYMPICDKQPFDKCTQCQIVVKPGSTGLPERMLFCDL